MFFVLNAISICPVNLISKGYLKTYSEDHFDDLESHLNGNGSIFVVFPMDLIDTLFCLTSSRFEY